MIAGTSPGGPGAEEGQRDVQVPGRDDPPGLQVAACQATSSSIVLAGQLECAEEPEPFIAHDATQGSASRLSRLCDKSAY